MSLEEGFVYLNLGFERFDELESYLLTAVDLFNGRLLVTRHQERRALFVREVAFITHFLAGFEERQPILNTPPGTTSSLA
jgi:hypothetical protein